jgi:uncharacterized protein
MAEPQLGFYPGRAPIDAYGDGGFRFAGMSHRGSLLLLPSGIHAWAATDAAKLTLADFKLLLAEAGAIEFILLGTGASQVYPPPAVRTGLEDAGFGLDAMSTGAAARTFNVLLAEGRKVAAALIAVP